MDSVLGYRELKVELNNKKNRDILQIVFGIGGNISQAIKIVMDA